VEVNEEEQEDDTIPILPVTNALVYVLQLRRLISSFDNADETLSILNKVENFLYSKSAKNAKQSKIDNFFF
jgi:hypothetical protein